MIRGTILKDALVGLAIVAAVAAYFIVNWLRPDPKAEIRALLTRMQAAAAEASTGAVLREIAPEYDADSGNRQELIKRIRGYFKEYGPTEVKIEGLSLTVEGKIAVADLTVSTTAANRDRWGADGALSVWRLQFALYQGRWYIEAVDPVSFMGEPVASLDFREELRRRAEEDLERSHASLVSEAERKRLEAKKRMAIEKRRRESMLRRFPVKAKAWLLDDFTEKDQLWAPREWGHPCKVLVVADPKGGKRLKLVVSRSAKDKVGLERPISLDMSSRDRLVVEAENAGNGDAQLAIAIKGQGMKGRNTWYESRPEPLPRGKRVRLAFDLRSETFKTRQTKWEHKVPARHLDAVGHLYLLIYTQRPGVFYIDRITAESDGGGGAPVKIRPGSGKDVPKGRRPRGGNKRGKGKKARPARKRKPVDNPPSVSKAGG